MNNLRYWESLLGPEFFVANRLVLKSAFPIALSRSGIATAAENVAPDQVWKTLQEGNARFARSAPIHPRHANTQHPFAGVLGCTDSRVPTEIIFDQGLGDLFVARTAGQVERLGIRLIVVLGHQQYAAVAAVLPGKPAAQGHIASLAEPSDRQSRKPTGRVATCSITPLTPT